MRSRAEVIRRARLALAGLIVPSVEDLQRMTESVRWDGFFTVEKFDAAELARDPRTTPYEVVESGHNLLLTSGANAYHQRLIGTGVTTFSSTNARLTVGDGTAAAVASQTDLQGTNKFRKLVDAAATVSGNQISFVSTFLTTDANFAWNEAGIVNTATIGTGDMLNRVVQAFGTKTSSLQWVLTGTIALS